MKFLYILLLVLIFSSTRAQRVVNIDRRELKNYLCEDLAFFRDYAALNIYNSKQDLFQYTFTKNSSWEKNKIRSIDLKNNAITFRKDTIINEYGDIVRYLDNPEINIALQFFVLSDDPELKNKIGLGFGLKNYNWNDSIGYIYFLEYKNLPSLKSVRRIRFLELMAKSLSKINEDTTINLFVKNTRNKFKIYYLEDKKEDTLNSLNRLVESLFVDYEASFARIYLSGKDSSFYTKNDEFGIIHMRADITHQEILPVVNVEGVVIKYKSIEAEKIYNIQTKAISLFIEKQLHQKITKIFPGILFEKEKEALNINPYDHYYLQDQVINRFSPISRTLFDYIVEINL